MRPRLSSWKWLLALGLGVFAAGLVLVLFRPAGFPSDIRGKVTTALAEWTGGKVEVKEPLRMRYFPPSLTGSLELTDATKLPTVKSISAPRFRVTLSLPQLLLGNIQFNALRMDRPVLELKANDADRTTEAVLGRLTTFLANAPLETVRIRGGQVRPEYAAPLLKDLDIRLNTPGHFGALDAQGSFTFNGENVAFSLDRGTPTDTDEGPSTPVTLKVTSTPLTARFSGTMQLGEDLKGAGELQAKLPDIRQFLAWVGVVLPKGESLKEASASGQVHWIGPTLTFDDGTFGFDGNEADGLLAITAGARPRLEGTLAFETLVLDPYLPDVSDETDDAPLFDWVLLKHLDADLRISAVELTAGGLELGSGGFTINAKNGAISSDIGALELCGGQAGGRFDLDLSDARSEVSLAGSLGNIELDSCLRSLDVAMPVAGAGTAKIDVSTGGTTKEELIRGLAGTLAIDLANGSLPVDLPALLEKPNGETVGWSKETGTPFSKLEAGCSLSAGHLWCQSFHLTTAKGIVSGAGGLDIAQQTLDWDLQMADPADTEAAAESVSAAQPSITINGLLATPLIGTAGGATAPDNASGQVLEKP